MQNWKKILEDEELRKNTRPLVICQPHAAIVVTTAASMRKRTITDVKSESAVMETCVLDGCR